MLIQLPVHSYRNASHKSGSERLINCYAESTPSGNHPASVSRTPGIKTALNVGTGTGRGLVFWQGTLYAVSGTSLYSISSGHVATLIGTVNGSAKVSFAETPTQLVICDPSYTYVYDSLSVSAIADVDFIGGVQCCSIDGYVLFRRANSGVFFSSDLADATAYNALMFATAEGLSDNIVGIIADHRQAILAGSQSMEIWYNAGISGFPFIRDANGFVEIGCAAGNSLAKADNTVFWLASDLTVRRLDGVTPIRISQHGVEQAIAGYTVEDAEGFAYTQGGHLFYVLTFPTSNATWVYDATTNEWHERQSYGLTRWRPRSAVLAYGRWYVQDYETGKVGYLDKDTYTDWDDTQRVEMTFQDIYSDGRRLRHSLFELLCEVGVGTSGQGADPQVTLERSDDSGQTWTTQATKSLGQVGEYKKRVRWHRLGSARFRTYRISISDPVKFIVSAANLEAA
jgi:hypothetical protein